MLSEQRVFNDSNPTHQLKESDWGYGQLLSTLLRRKLWLISIFLGTLAVTLLLTLKTKPLYQSSMQILIEPNYKGRSNGSATTATEISDPQVQVDLTTQLQILQSSELLQKAVDRLLTKYPDFTIENLQSGLTLFPVYGSDANNKKIQTNLLQIDFIDSDPKRSRNVLQTLLPIYQSYNLEQQKLRLAKGLAFINEQLPTVRQSVSESEAALQQFRRINQTIDPNEQSKTASVSLEMIRQQREDLKAQIGQALANYKSAQQQLSMSPKGAIASAQLSESSLYQSRLQAIQKLDLEIQQQRQLFTEEHPVVQGLVKQRQEEDKALQQEAARVLGRNQASIGSPNDLVSQGQLGDNGVALAKQLTDAQNNYLSLQAKDKSLAQTEAQLTQDLQKYPALIAQYERLQPEVEVRRSTLQKLLDAKQDLSLEIARGGYNWEVIEAPTEGLQISPIFLRNLLLGGVVGLFLGSIAAFFRDSLDDTVRSAEQLGERMPLPLLGGLPWLSNTLPSSNFNPLAFNGTNTRTALDNLGLFHWQPLRDALDLIYGNIQFRNAKKPHQVLMVTSALPGEGKSTLALGLALSAARLDQKVLLIDADLRHASLHQRLELSNEEGLSTLLMSDMPPAELKTTPQWVYMRWEEEAPLSTTRPMQSIPPSDVNMDILTAGPVYGDPVKLLQFDRMKEILNSFRDEYDLIIVDCPPVLGLVDTMQIGYGCDGVVMIARAEKVTHSDLMTAISNLSKFNLIGCVMNGVEQSNRSYGRNYAYQ